MKITQKIYIKYDYPKSCRFPPSLPISSKIHTIFSMQSKSERLSYSAQNPGQRTLTKKTSYCRIETTIGGFNMPGTKGMKHKPAV